MRDRFKADPSRRSAPRPFARFSSWFRAAGRRPGLPEAACLATVSSSGRPQARFVLVKEFGPRGFVFYTNLGSPKARSLRARPRAALAFHWEPLARQVRVEGRVRPLSRARADAYFASRPRDNQIAAWASRQSGVLESRAALRRRAAAAARRFAGRAVPRPPDWGGFAVIPDRIEFWSGRPDRLNDRLLCVRRGRAWSARLLFP